jgi:group I intron endonuclease
MPRKRKLMLGLVFGRLTVVGDAPTGNSGHHMCRCVCVCGSEIITQATNLRNGNTKSCGCLKIGSGRRERDIIDESKKVMIYRIINTVTGKSYIGQTSVSIDRRMKHHVHMAMAGNKNGCRLLHNSIRKHGWPVFTVHIVCVAPTRGYANFLEEQLINAYGTISPDGYNLKSGGKASAHHAETKLKIHQANLGRQNMLGHRHTPETLAKMRASALRRISEGRGNLGPETEANRLAVIRTPRILREQWRPSWLLDLMSNG